MSVSNFIRLKRDEKQFSMKKAFTIIVAVTAYSLVEIVALLCNLGPGDAAINANFESVFCLGALFLLIPGMAVLFSRFLYGAANWKKRVLGALTVVAGGTIVSWGVLCGVGLAVDWRASNLVLSLILLPIFVGVCFAMFLIVGRARKQSVQLEAARWLAERHSGISPGERRWRVRAIRWSLWIPTCTVLLVVFCLPALWGIVSHVFWPGASHFGESKVPIPITWVVLNDELRAENRWTSGLAAESFAFGFREYRRGEFPLASWILRLESPEHWLPKDDEIVARRSVTVAGVSGTCVQYWPSYLKQQKQSQESAVAYVMCSLRGRLCASFSGEKSQLPDFYKMLEGIKQEKPRQDLRSPLLSIVPK